MEGVGGAISLSVRQHGAFHRNHNFGLTANTWRIAGTGEFDLA